MHKGNFFEFFLKNHLRLPFSPFKPPVQKFFVYLQTKFCSGRGVSKCAQFIDNNYMFYLAFENSFCEDYVTEKLWDHLKGNLVPVVYGHSNYQKIAPPHSYINALDFDSPKDLADYLKYLMANTTAYYEYFKWTGYFTVYQDQNRVFCQICEALNMEPSKHKVYKNLKSWWQRPGTCISGPHIPISNIAQATYPKIGYFLAIIISKAVNKFF
jgi:hypothetical protein